MGQKYAKAPPITVAKKTQNAKIAPANTEYSSYLQGPQGKLKPRIMVHHLTHTVASNVHLLSGFFYQGVQTIGMLVDLRRRRGAESSRQAAGSPGTQYMQTAFWACVFLQVVFLVCVATFAVAAMYLGHVGYVNWFQYGAVCTLPLYFVVTSPLFCLVQPSTEREKTEGPQEETTSTTQGSILLVLVNFASPIVLALGENSGSFGRL